MQHLSSLTRLNLMILLDVCCKEPTESTHYRVKQSPDSCFEGAPTG